MDFKAFYFTSFFLITTMNYINSRTHEPTVRPFHQINIKFKFMSRFSQFLQKVFQSSVFILILLEVTFQSLLHYFSPKIMEKLLEPSRTLSIRYSIKYVLSLFSVYTIHGNGMSCWLCVIFHSPELLA